MKRVLYILRKICLIIEAIINITNKKKYCRSIVNIAESIINIAESIIYMAESIINVIESIIRIFKVL